MPLSKKLRARDKYLQRVYGITLKVYNQLLKKQGNSCAICKKHKSLEKKSFAVDHDHKSPFFIRGVLCSFCNHKLIGRHRNPDLFEAAAKYLRQNTGLMVPPRKKKKRKKT